MADHIFHYYYLYFRSVIFVLIISVLTISVIKFVKTKWRFINLAMKLPGPRAYPLIGNALKFACKTDKLLERVVEVITPYVDQTPIRLWMGSQLYVVIIEPHDIEVILNSQQATSKGDIYKLLYPFIGNGLISGSGNTWKAHRKLLSHIMNQRLLDFFVEAFDRRSKELVDKLVPLSNGQVFDVLMYMECCSINIVCEIIAKEFCTETVMGHASIDALNHPNHEFIYYTTEMYNIVVDRMMQIWLHPDWIFKMTKNYLKQRQAQKIISNFTESCIAEIRKEMSEEQLGTSMLQRLLEINNKRNELSHEELRDEIYTVYIAAQDTLAVISSFALLMLGIHKDVQSKARLEVDEVMNNQRITPELLPKLKYIEMVIKETLRLFPIAPLMLRRLIDELKLGNVTLPKGCQVVLVPYVTHRSSKYWVMPDKFTPERFMVDNNKTLKKPLGTFMPFSGGPMGCIGKKYAVMCLKILLANVLEKFVIESNTCLDDVKLKTDISIRSISGYKVALQLRNDIK